MSELRKCGRLQIPGKIRRYQNSVDVYNIPCYIGSMPTDLHQILKLESSIKALEQELQSQRHALDALRRNCAHEWGEAENADIVTPAYTDPGDPPGTMGIDWRGPQYVPEQRTRRWKRVCQCCNLVQYTSEAAPQITERPVFR